MLKNDTIPIDKLKQKVEKSRFGQHFVPSRKINAIIKKKIKEYGVLCSKVKKERMLYALRGDVRHVWKVKFGVKKPAASYVIFIDRFTGQVIEERNLLKKVSGKGQVFRPNPVVTLERDDLYDRRDSKQKIFEPAYRIVELKGLKKGRRLRGSYVDTTDTPRCAQSSTLEFIFDRRDNRFEEVMAYYHIDAVQRYIQKLGFVGGYSILASPIKVNVHGTRKDQSYYDPSPGRQDITYGDGGVDDAEDADVIVHEYGHALQDAIVPGFGQTHEGMAMGEGFCDYLAASFFCRYKRGDRKLRFAEWDATSISDEPGGLRRLDMGKHYPEDMEGVGYEHDDGEIWSECLWNIRKKLGKKRADTAIIESHFYLNQYSDFKDGAEAIIMANANLYGGKKGRALRRIFRNKGIL
jgi:Zn-dependent metalloprotease